MDVTVKSRDAAVDIRENCCKSGDGTVNSKDCYKSRAQLSITERIVAKTGMSASANKMQALRTHDTSCKKPAGLEVTQKTAPKELKFISFGLQNRLPHVE